MFKKLKDKLAEEVKSSPQRIQQFAQAAQAAVTSASSSISDITNNDLFSIGDNDNQQTRLNTSKPQSSSSTQNTFQDVSLVQPLQSTSDLMDYVPSHDIVESQRQRRLSNSSFASDVSFRLPSYETPSMYHLQSDMEVSASEAEERGFSSGTVSLDRVTKEQLFAAYRRTQDRYTKYRTQYSDLARHYKLLERENAKARSVLVETQDKALRRISELREQCSLEQSAKAHLEKALRVEIEEKNMKIESLNTKIIFLQHDPDDKSENKTKSTEGDGDVQLINLSNEIDSKTSNEESTAAEIISLNNKIEKMEQLLNKYKDSLKTSKEKNSQINTEMQILSNELENKSKEIEQIKVTTDELNKANRKIQELQNLNEELQNKINVYEFSKTREQSTLEIDFEKAQEEIEELRSKIEVFSKREEEYAISLAENKLSIHKELESKEAEIKSLKDSLEATKKEIQSLNIVITDYKNSVASLESERAKLSHDSSELSVSKSKILELETQLQDLKKKCHQAEQLKTKADEGYKCLQMQMKQETAEKLAMIDRNVYLENRNTQLNEENIKKSTQISNLESELQKREEALKLRTLDESKQNELIKEIDEWKDKYAKLESEIQEERDELINLQSEIEKLLANHELMQTQNVEFRKNISDLESDNEILQDKLIKHNKLRSNCLILAKEIKDIKKLLNLISHDAKSLQKINNEALNTLLHEINYSLKHISFSDAKSKTTELNEMKIENEKLHNEIRKNIKIYESLTSEINQLRDENNNLKSSVVTLELEKNAFDEELKKIRIHSEATVKEFENNVLNLQIAIESENQQYLSAVEKLKALENEKQTLTEKIVSAEKENSVIKTDLVSLKSQFNTNMEALEDIKNKNNDLIDQIKELENGLASKNQLQEEINHLNHENIDLKMKVESMANSYKKLESEINEVRKSHAEIEAEKDRLNEIIEKLENDIIKDTMNKDSQTDDMYRKNVMSEFCTAELISENEQTLGSDKLNDTGKMKAIDLQDIKTQQNLELSRNYQSLKNDYDSLKEENRRFKSDIEGLQTYLTKISKENSVLNDKLRELIATSEHSSDSKENSGEITHLQRELQSGKEKIDDLIRENTLLVEENLELKDQLQSQNYPKSDTKPMSDDATSVDKEKYNNLLQVKTTLEQRLNELEQMNKSVNVNMIQMQEKNDRLRFSNEKLERRLDEALVSLRHLHSLQENTELEYLRNILYEYLTGSGTHSVTLAKVLAAIVKFDDMQTKLVLQKEKERQGFLRQLGII